MKQEELILSITVTNCGEDNIANFVQQRSRTDSTSNQTTFNQKHVKVQREK